MTWMFNSHWGWWWVVTLVLIALVFFLLGYALLS